MRIHQHRTNRGLLRKELLPMDSLRIILSSTRLTIMWDHLAEIFLIYNSIKMQNKHMVTRHLYQTSSLKFWESNHKLEHLNHNSRNLYLKVLVRTKLTLIHKTSNSNCQVSLSYLKTGELETAKKDDYFLLPKVQEIHFIAQESKVIQWIIYRLLHALIRQKICA